MWAATRFSVFWYFKRNENIISGIFADLLRGDGSHGQGTTFFDLFLEEIDRDREDGARYRRAAEYRARAWLPRGDGACDRGQAPASILWYV